MGSKTSRKTKRAWVKNIDLKDIEDNLEQNREKQRLFGPDEDFVIDETASDLKSVKKLKSTEILTNKSKIPALAVERNRRKKSKNIARLMKISGRIDNSTSMASIDKNGLLNVKSEDIWDQPEEVVEEYPVHLPKSKSKVKINRPVTISKAPISLDYEVKDIHEGKSYNPSLESWKSLINEEFGIEQIKELNRQQLIEKQELLARLMAEQEEESDDDEDDNDNEEPNDNNDTNDFKLSINKPTVTKKKTKAQRNKEVRHQKRQELELKLKDLKRQITEISRLDLDEIKEKDETKVEKKDKVSKKPTKLYKYRVMESPLEVKLSNELNSNLKNVKAEGNLFYSNMINLQTKGLIEARVPVVKKSKYKPKITEKWTYKDFK